MPFTPEELAEMAAFDAELDADMDDAYRLASRGTDDPEKIRKRAWYYSGKQAIKKRQQEYRLALMTDPINQVKADLIRARKKRDGLKWRDVADRLGCSYRTVVSKSNRAAPIDISFFEPVFPGIEKECAALVMTTHRTAQETTTDSIPQDKTKRNSLEG